MKKASSNKRKLQAAETKRRIFDAAHRLVLEHGFENVSVDSIVEAAGVSKGAFYVHFESKDALGAAFVNNYTKIADMDYKSFMLDVSKDKSVFECLILIADKISDFLDANIGLDNIRVLYKAHLTKTIDTSSAISYNRELYNVFAEILKRGVRQGELREDISVELMAKHLVLAIRGITFEWCIRYPDFDLKEQVLSHFNILLYGLKKPEG